MRAHHYLFGERPEARVQPTDPLEQVMLTPRVSRFLLRQAQQRGQAHSGLLFGLQREGTLTVALATPARWPTPSNLDPLTLDLGYLLGASEAVGAAFAGRIDWCGLWLTFPNSEFGPASRIHDSCSQAIQRGLVDDHSVLLIAGFLEGSFAVQACVGGVGQEPLALPTTMF